MVGLESLANRLESRGPVGAAFAAYLSARVDLLTQIEALELAGLRVRAPTTPYATVRKLFAAETGIRLESALGSIDPEPFDSGPVVQWHRARLESGERVLFKVAHQGMGDLSNTDLDVLSQAAGLPPTSRIPGEFKSFLARSLDLRQEADDLIKLRERCEKMSLVTVPRVHRELSGSRFLTLADPGGLTAGEWLPAPEAGERLPAAAQLGSQRWARRLCRAWLRLVVSAGTVPVSPAGRNVLLLEDGKVAFCGGPFHSLSGHVREQLRSYLAATAIGDHESMAEVLLDLGQPHSSASDRRLRHQLRHTASFRDGGWDSDSDSLSRAVLAHGHRAATLGLRASPGLRAFSTGLAVLSREAGMLASGENSFREAFQEVRLYQLFEEAKRLAVAAEIAPLADLPRKLDRGLTLAADGGAAGSARPSGEEESTGSWPAVLSLLMALGTIVLLTHHIAPAIESPRWVEGAGAIGALVVGGLALRFAVD